MSKLEHQANLNIQNQIVTSRRVNIYDQLAKLEFAKQVVENAWNYVSGTRNISVATTVFFFDHIETLDKRIKNYKDQIEDMPVVTYPRLNIEDEVSDS